MRGAPDLNLSNFKNLFVDTSWQNDTLRRLQTVFRKTYVLFAKARWISSVAFRDLRADSWKETCATRLEYIAAQERFSTSTIPISQWSRKASCIVAFHCRRRRHQNHFQSGQLVNNWDLPVPLWRFIKSTNHGSDGLSPQIAAFWSASVTEIDSCHTITTDEIFVLVNGSHIAPV